MKITNAQIIADLEGEVYCDICNEDYSNSDESGGFVFTSKGYCPKCAVEGLKNIRKYNEEQYIKAVCPEGMSFKDFIIEYRDGNNLVIMGNLDFND